MFKKRSKKGLSHVDWAMSLGIFILYLAWFFIFVRPMLSSPQTADVLLDILDEGVSETIFQDVHRIKVFIDTEYAGDAEPVIIPFDSFWPSYKIAHTADYFVIDDALMFFQANLSNSTTQQIYYPHKAHEQTPPRFLVSNDDRVWIGSFNAHFNNYLLEDVRFLGETRLQDFTVEVDETELNDEGSYENWTFLAKYRMDADPINFTSYIFADNSRIYSRIRNSDFRNHSVVIEFATYNYTRFYMDPMTHGELDYDIMENCRWYETDFLDLYDFESGLLITFDENISLRLCSNETNSKVRMEFDHYVESDNEFNLYFHEGTVDDVLHYPLRPGVGVTESLRTVSADAVALLRSRDYSYLKQLFGYPDANDFNVTISSSRLSVSAGITRPELADIYARKINGFIIDEFYQPQDVNITLTVW